MNDAVRINLPNQFSMAIKLITDNGLRITDMIEDLDNQTSGIDSVALVQMIDTIEVATRLARTEIHRALKYQSYQRR